MPRRDFPGRNQARRGFNPRPEEEVAAVASVAVVAAASAVMRQ
jgi:hypothetical protein